MSKPPDEKGLLNELLPDPDRGAADLDAGSPRARTAEHLKRVLAAGLALQLASDLAACRTGAGTAQANTAQSQPRPEPTGYGVVDPVPPPIELPLVAAARGLLTLESTPPATITVDGTAVSSTIDGVSTTLMTPQKIYLSPGTHTIVLSVPGEQIEQRFTVDIKSGETHTEVRDLRARPTTPPNR